MTQGHSPNPRSGRAVEAEHETTALPDLSAHSAPTPPPVTPPSDGQSGDGFSTPSYVNSGSAGNGSSVPNLFGPGTPVRPLDTESTGAIGSVGAKIAAASAAAVSAASSAATSAVNAASSAATSAKEAIRGSATSSGSAGAGAGVGETTTSSAASSRAAGRVGSGRASARGGRQPRKARLTLSHINVYSVFKFSCVLAIALFFVWLIMVGVLYGLLDVAGVLDQVNSAVRRITGDDNAKDVVTGSIVFGSAIIIGAVNIVLFIAISTIGSMVYNLCADLVGGAEVTLSERD